MLQKIKTNPYANMVWVALSCAVHIALFRPKTILPDPLWQRLLTMVAALVLTFVLHEGLHYVLMRLFGKGDVQVRIMKSPIGLPTLGVVAQSRFRKWQLAIIYLAPFALLTLLPDFIFMLTDKVELLFFIVSVGNCAGCFYDIAETLILSN